MNSLLESVKFTPISLQAPEAWCGHMPFAAWLIHAVNPKIFVELGTHSGNSYFSFCQSVKENNLATKCYAVDTWRGDKHAGLYGDEIFDQVDKHNKAHYAHFSRLLRMAFGDALSYFSDGSIDLLHIDGLHTYDAVKHDFETWLPKLAPSAIVLLHDTNVRENEFGVWKLWEELQERYPDHLEFLHSHGLGVLQLNAPPASEKKFAWLNPGSLEQRQIQDYFSALGGKQLERYEFEQTKRHISAINQLLVSRNEEIARLNQTLANRDARIDSLDQALANRDARIDSLNQALAERDARIDSLNQALANYDTRIDSLNQALANRDTRIDALNRALAERDIQIEKLNQSINEILGSTSWRVTYPLRILSIKVKILIGLIRILPDAIHICGGIGGLLNKTRKVYAREGWTGIKQRIIWVDTKQKEALGYTAPSHRFSEAEDKADYAKWIQLYDTLTDTDREKIKSDIEGFKSKPLFSVIMPVYNPPLQFFERAIQSVRNQLYPNWELCIADDASTDPSVRKIIDRHCRQDARIKVVYRTANGHISEASNSALALAQGDFIAMVDHDDAIAEHALYLFAEEINRNPEVDFLYSDQDKIDTHDIRYDPYFKPDFNPDLLRSQNFVDHLAVFRTSVVRKLDGWRTEFNGSQDYDLVLRVTEQISPLRIKHIPYVLYHWRAVPGSLATHSEAKSYAPETSRKALAEHLERLNLQAEVTSHHPHLSIHRVIYSLPEEPLVSIIIPTKDGVDILSKCIDGLLNKTDYKNFEIIIVNNQSKEPATYEYFKSLSTRSNIKIIDFNEPFNYSKINNIAVSKANGTVLALLNNDIEIINRDWLREMVSHAMRPEIGAVGARLYYPDGTVQHAGVLLGYKGKAGHMYRHASPEWLGYWARAVLIQNLTAVTAACMVLRKQVFNEVEGFDENFSVTFNDVDLCLRIHERGYRNLYTPYAEMYHHESKTRGLLAHQSEEDYFAIRWKAYIEGDPAYNPNLSLNSENFALAFPPRVHQPWIKPHESGNLPYSPLVTIITRTHGERQDFLKQALTSIFQQTYRPIQIVVVEDGSEGSRSLINTIIPPSGINIDYISTPKLGRCHAGNCGLEMSRGQLIGFLDDDDLFLPDHLDSLVRHLLSHPSAVGAYACSWEVPTEVLSLSPLKYNEGKKYLFGYSNWSLSNLWNYNYITIQSLIFRKELYMKHGGFSLELDCLEDWDLWLRYTAEGDFVFLNKPTSEFRIPKNEAVLLDRRKQHLKYLPALRKRQKELLSHYKDTVYYERLYNAFEAISGNQTV
jgi:glycosyltransferase involved in cell wall biosynthesis/uncharacterized coiled-coil protein SlyX